MNIQIPIIGQQTRAGFVPQDNQFPILVDDERGAALQGFARSLGDLASGVAAWQKGSAQSMPQNPPPADNPPMAESLPAAASANPPSAGPAGADGPGLSPETGASPAAYDPKHPNPVARQDYENAKSQACLAVPTLRNTASRLFADTSASLGPGLPGLVPKVLKGFDEAVEQTLQACTTPESRLYVIEYAKTGRRQLAALCLVSEAQAGVALRETRYRESAAGWAGVVKDDLGQFPAALTALHHAEPDLAPAQKEQTRDDVRTTLLQAGFMAAIKQNPLATYQALVRAGGREDGAPDQSPAAPGNAALDPLVKVMTPAEREHYAPLAYAAWHDAQATQREAFKTRAADAAASFKATGTAPNAPTEPEFITHLGEAEGKRQFQQQRIDALTGQAEQAARTLPVPALAQLRDQADPTTPEGAAVHRAIANIETRRRADPIAYALQNGSYGLAPITSFDDPQALQAELGKRRRAASAIGKDYELFATLLTREEGKLLATTLRGKPAAEQLALLEQFTGGAAATASATAPDSAADAALIYTTLRGLSADAKVPALAAKLRYEEQRQEAAGAGPSSWGGTGKISAPQTLLEGEALLNPCLLYTSPSPRDGLLSRMPSSA